MIFSYPDCFWSQLIQINKILLDFLFTCYNVLTLFEFNVICCPELFGKAKKIILKQDDSERSFNYSDTLSPAGVSGFVEWEEQELGKTISLY